MIKPCPFCGGMNLYVNPESTAGMEYWIVCKSCGATGPKENIDIGIFPPIEEVAIATGWDKRNE